MTRKPTLIAALTALTALTAGAALAGDDCRVDAADRQPRAAVIDHARANGWTVRKIEIDDGCYEIEGRDKAGRKIKVKLDPATLRIVEMDGEDDDDERARAGNPAPAGVTQPPRNKLFGNGAPPKAQVN